jgi:hypothetical protein
LRTWIQIKIESEIDDEEGIKIEDRHQNQEIRNRFRIGIEIKYRDWNRNQKSRSRLGVRIEHQVEIENRDRNRELGLRSKTSGRDHGRGKMDMEMWEEEVLFWRRFGAGSCIWSRCDRYCFRKHKLAKRSPVFIHS